MTPSQPEREAPLETNNKPDDAGMDWAAILASLAKLEAGLHRVDADLGRLQADIEAFAGSDEVCAEECGGRP